TLTELACVIARSTSTRIAREIDTLGRISARGEFARALSGDARGSCRTLRAVVFQSIAVVVFFVTDLDGLIGLHARPVIVWLVAIHGTTRPNPCKTEQKTCAPTRERHALGSWPPKHQILTESTTLESRDL